MIKQRITETNIHPFIAFFSSGIHYIADGCVRVLYKKDFSKENAV